MNIKNKLNPLNITLVLYGIIIMLILLVKPRYLFNRDGSIKCSDFKCNKPVFSFPIIIVFLSVTLYLLVTFIYLSLLN